jgi:serine/threonine-protein kinase
MYAVQIQSKAYDTGRIDIVSLGTGERKTLVEGGAFPRYASSGHLLYIREGTLQAAPFSPARLEVTGPPRPVLENVLSSTGGQEVSDGSAQYDLSPSGLLAYRIGTPFRGDQEMVWMDREGQRTPVGIKPGAFSSPAISPQGDRVAVAIEAGSGTDLWIYEIERGTLSRLTFDGAESSYPIWSPDGMELIFSSTRDGGVPNLFRVRADGTGQATRLTTSAKPQFPTSLSRDGRTLLLMERDPTGGWDVMQLRMADATETPIVNTTSLEGGGVFSPDGRYVAYVSDESGKFEVFVRPFPGPGGKWQVSVDGGGLVRWSPDGRELAFCDGRTVFVVPTETGGGGFRAGKPRRLFDVGFQVDLAGSNFVFAPDGKRFLLVTPPRNQANSPEASVTLVFGWLDELRRLVPAAAN